jgi:hypothetical protein
VAPYRRLSESPLWATQRRFYERAGIDAWRTATVPHHVTSNVALATAYARIIAGFARDAARPEPLDVIEFGAGSGRFAFLLLRALDTLGTPVRYLMTDVAKSTIDFWRGHDALRPFVRAGRLGFARLDARRVDAALLARTLGAARRAEARSERARARTRASPGCRTRRLVVVANYVFSGLPHDAFVRRADRIHEYRVATRQPPGRTATPASLGRGSGTPESRGGEVATAKSASRADAISLAWRTGPRVTEPYADPHLDAVMRVQVTAGGAEPTPFPVGALRTLQQLKPLADEILVLVADRAIDATAGSLDLGLARHGSLSFPVGFPALRAWVKRTGGRSLGPPRPQPLLHVEAFLLGRRHEWPATRRAYARAMSGGGPAELYRERRALGADRGRRTTAALLALMRRCGPDPRVVAECVRPLWPHLAEAGPRLRRDVARAALAAWPNHYPLGEAHDVAFDLGLLLYAARAYAAARELFEASLRLHGDDAATFWNLGLCHLALGRPQAARAAFRRAHHLAPGRHVAGLATVKAARASQRGHRSGPARGG